MPRTNLFEAVQEFDPFLVPRTNLFVRVVFSRTIEHSQGQDDFADQTGLFAARIP